MLGELRGREHGALEKTSFSPNNRLCSVLRKIIRFCGSIFLNPFLKFFLLPALFILGECRHQDQNKCDLVAKEVK